MKIQAIIPTAGTGTRFNANNSKSFVELCGKPLIVYALEVFEKSAVMESVILVGHKDKLDEFQYIVEKHGLTKVKSIVPGGKTRRDSVNNGIAELDDDTSIVAVHDGARPLITLAMIEEAIKLCQTWDAVVNAVPVKPTIKRVNKKNLCVEETLDREELWEIQTPQIFKRDVLVKAHKANLDIKPTDDAMMVEALGVDVKIILGDYNNIKVTTQEDLTIAEALLKANDHMAVRS